MARKSKRALVRELSAMGLVNYKGNPFQEFNAGIHYEAYGRDVRAYVVFADNKARRDAERKLRAAGWPVNEDYWPGSSTTDVGVSYFKAWHWDE